jgi:ATP-binding cassette subfamily B (MDR/TAP) protein 1
MLFIFNCFAAIEFYISYKLIINNKISVNDFINSFKLVTNNISNIIRTFKFFKNITTIKDSLIRLSYLKNIKSEIEYKECNNESIVEYKNNIKGKINFEKVKFSYPENPNQIVLNSMDFEINPSEKLAIIGESGCGKSTIPQLIERFYEQNEGEIKIDNNNIKYIEIKKLRNVISYVQQEENLFNRSIYDNIRYSNLNASDEEIYNVIKLCGLEQIVSIIESKKGENKKEYERLSGGQIQKICIARAILKNPKILILDECTSGMDNKSEKEIQDTIDNIIQKSNITTIITAHKKSVIKKCNKCFIIKNGKVWKQLDLEEIQKLYN